MSTAAGEKAREHGSRIITALERARTAIRARHPEIPDAVIVTGAGSNQKGTPEGYRLRGRRWPGRRMPELSAGGKLLAAGRRGTLSRSAPARRGRQKTLSRSSSESAVSRA